MTTKLAAQPKILGWMDPAHKKFRKDFPDLAQKLPEYTFFDKVSFRIDGYFVGQNIGSVVLQVRDKRGVYIVKSTYEPETVTAEVAFLKAWHKAGADVVKVLDFIRPSRSFPAAVAILEYVPGGTTEDYLKKHPRDLALIYRRFGKGLANLHRAKGKGFGTMIHPPKLQGRHGTFGAEIRSLLTPQRLKTLVANGLLRKADMSLVDKAIAIVEDDVRRGTKPSLIHDDPGLHNTFGTTSLKFFDPGPKLSHPLEDVAIALVWATFDKGGSRMREALLAGYRSARKFDDQVLQACLFLKLLEKWEWWLHRGKTEKHALGWIRRTKGLFREARSALLEGQSGH